MLRSIVKRRLRMPLCHRRTNAALCTINVSASTDHTLPAQSSRQAASEQGRRFVSEDSASPSISAAEMSKFSALAETWWDSRGPFKALHLMNPARISFIRSVLCKHFRKDTCCARPLKGLHILDVGCGGGLLCEPLARLGARVVGIDAVEKNIKVAAAHAVKDPLTASIKYLCTTSDKLVGEGYEQFDAVISLEVIEHVTEPKMFVESLAGLTKADGSIIISTINRSISGYFLAIIAAEHLLQWVPKGTHEWSKFITPSELALLMDQAGLKLHELAGMVFNPLTSKWSLSDDTNVNYIAFGTKHNLGQT